MGKKDCKTPIYWDTVGFFDQFDLIVYESFKTFFIHLMCCWL